MTAAVSWVQPHVKGRRRKPRPPFTLRRAARRAAFELFLAGGVFIGAGWRERIALGIVLGAVMLAAALVVVTA